MLARNGLQQLGVDMSGDQFAQGRGLEESGTEQARETFRLQQIRHLVGGKKVDERLILAGADKSEGRHQSARACSGYDRELRPRSSRRPTGQEACAKCSVGATA